MGDENFVTIDKCETHRREIDIRNNKQDVSISSLQTDMSFVKGILMSILGVLISGFVGTIFTLLKVL